MTEVTGSVEVSDPHAPPVIRTTRWNSIVLIPIAKKVVIFSSDDPTSKYQLELDVTATPVH
jgi:hypothetical protein